MPPNKLNLWALCITSAGLVGLLTVFLPGCEKETASPEKPPAAPEESLAVEPDVKFVNVRCPMMDSEIKLEKVDLSLVREFKGKKVAFCCPGCPIAWEKLSDEEKETKLKAVLPSDP